MILYHYSKDFFKDLRTLKVRKVDINNNLIPDNEYRVGNYNDHISLFLEPAPLDIIGSIFKDTGNEVWVNGNQLYEYEVNTDHVQEFKYDIVETDLANDFLYNNKYRNLSDEEWLKLLYAEKKKICEIGYSKKEFLKVANKYVGSLRESFVKLPSRPNWNEIKTKYAPTCVHVMLYPIDGIIEYDKVNKVVVKNNQSKHLSTKW